MTCSIGKLRKRYFKNNWMVLLVFILLGIAPLFLSDFRVNMLGKFVAYAILALGIDLIWGYTGILSLGHGVYFGLGAYCMAMYLKLAASGGGLPDFMTWSGQTVLPWFWKPFESIYFAVFMAILIPVLLAALVGFLTFKNRIQGVYFSILTQALSMIFVVLFIGQQKYTGGTNGITNFKTILGFSITSPETRFYLYYISVLLLLLSYLFCKFIIGRRIGKILIAIRDGENRTRFSGYNPTTYKVFVYCISAALAGLAGAIFVPQVGIISPENMGVVPSVEMVIWVAIGGRGTLVGGVLGAILVNIIKSLLSENFPAIWSYFIGITFVVVVIFLPAGLMGTFKQIKEKAREMKVTMKTKPTGSKV
ncbi:urea ABC transporter permease subunit UrtC [Clostridium formicaceticum]|uniref:Leucine/isoleucine/valine transporter permease subunit n=1 Tax=Clostridium formicaceticum TaxID=1497 RepID=A0AAC9WFK0_9CLOT|nr:urea ABC transporter permease subunit UrtC [Clostridium formicaceticum]AOY76440.1 urea ABC transporter permease subunit UrtC [Clostridium formicaceticum]ARE86836.1 leucine/isoleucine/valine transporter permease subunit [Clostridium formicaceticum]